MNRIVPIAAASILVLSLGACGALRPDRALRGTTGVTAHDLCSETFVSGLIPEAVYKESLLPRPGFGLVSWSLVTRIDREHREVSASIAGALESRARFREGLGCVLVHDGVPARAAGGPAPATAAVTTPAPAQPPALLPPITDGAAVVTPTDPALAAALEAAFTETPAPPHEQTKAVVVLRDGRIVAERYAPGYAVETPVLGFSMSKSVINALLGILVQEGRLDVKAPAPVAAWQQAGDPRRAITVEHLMRMTSGLDLDETGSGFDPSNQMFYVEPDMAAFAERASLKAAPGTRWFYSSASVHLLARIIRERTGGGADSVQRFAAEKLFGPLGIHGLTMEADATGTPIGAHYMLAPARDWARFGALFVNDGMVGGKRLLPVGWIAFSTTPTLDTDYGAGWWPNRTQNPNGARLSKLDMPLVPGVPADTFYALGNLGQYLAVIPSERLVILRLGRAHTKDFGVEAFGRLVAQTVAAYKPRAP